MSDLRQALQEYLQIRRSLGYQLRSPAWSLRGFVAFMEEQGAFHITTDLAVRWAKLPKHNQPSTWAQRLGFVRKFAAWLSASDPLTEVPPEGVFPTARRRKAPYIYTDQEVVRLVETARLLDSPRGLRGLTYSTVFGLLAVTGMRISEAMALDRVDVDLQTGILTLRGTKFGKTRMVPLHQSTCQALRDYVEARDRCFPVTLSRAFFVAERGSRITNWSTSYNFAKVSREVGLRKPAGGYRHGHGPRIHDLRHRFAVKTLIGWYRAGLDAERYLPVLSTYLGHVHVHDTYWYIQAVPELLQLATERLERGRREEDRR